MYLTEEQVREGLRVKLRADNIYGASASNPAIDSEWECVGTLDGPGNPIVSVAWDNGTSNTYKYDQLILADGLNYKDIWSEI